MKRNRLLRKQEDKPKGKHSYLPHHATNLCVSIITLRAKSVEHKMPNEDFREVVSTTINRLEYAFTELAKSNE